MRCGLCLRSAPGTASVYKMRLRADPHRSQITCCSDVKTLKIWSRPFRGIPEHTPRDRPQLRLRADKLPSPNHCESRDFLLVSKISLTLPGWHLAEHVNQQANVFFLTRLPTCRSERQNKKENFCGSIFAALFLANTLSRHSFCLRTYTCA